MYLHTTTHCSTCQHIKAHCSTLQHTATNYSKLLNTAAHYITLQHTATHYNTLQHTSTQCNTLQHISQFYWPITNEATHTAYTATHCTTLQHTETHYNTPQHISHIYWPITNEVACEGSWKFYWIGLIKRHKLSFSVLWHSQHAETFSCHSSFFFELRLLDPLGPVHTGIIWERKRWEW